MPSSFFGHLGAAVTPPELVTLHTLISTVQLAGTSGDKRIGVTSLRRSLASSIFSPNGNSGNRGKVSGHTRCLLSSNGLDRERGDKIEHRPQTTLPLPLADQGHIPSKRLMHRVARDGETGPGNVRFAQIRQRSLAYLAPFVVTP